MNTEQAAVKRNKVWSIVGIVSITLAILIVGAYGVILFIETQTWDPLGTYPLQISRPVPNTPTPVVSDEEGSGLVAIYWDQDIQTDAIKCVRGDENIVKIAGEFWWVSDEPPGRIILAGEAATNRGPGCTQATFLNEIPDKVRAEMEELAADGFEFSDWHLAGTEVPQRDGAEGRPRSWVTTTFRVVHKDAPTDG